AVYVIAPPEAGVIVMVTVLLASPVPTSVGLVLLVRLSVADVPVSLVASCLRPIAAVGAVWSSVNEPVAVVLLPAASVETTLRPIVAAGAVWSSVNARVAVVLLPAASVDTTLSATLPSGRPAAGIVPAVGATALVSTDQLPAASVVAVYVSAPPEDGVTV